jgi:cytochrome c oxidase cbb3-type subunit III
LSRSKITNVRLFLFSAYGDHGNTAPLSGEVLIAPSTLTHKLSLAHCTLGRCLLLGVAMLLPGATVRAQQSHIPGKTNPFDTPEAQAGMQLFRQTCGMCHGPEARGGEGPSLIDSSLVRHDDDGNLIGPLLHQGRTEKGMPAFAYFNDKQVEGIVAFLHAAVTAADNRGAGGPATGYSAKQFETGNAASGKAFFAANCAACHSVSGDLAGVARKYAPLELERQILYPRLGSRTATVHLPGGQTYKGTVLHLDAFFIAISDTQGGYHSWPLGNGTRVELDDPLRGHRELLARYHDKDIHDVFTYLEALP